MALLPQIDAQVLEQPTSDSVRDALARVLASGTFRTAPVLTAFLRYVVDATLGGEAKSIKAYTVAVCAMGRREDFDPTTDAIVRVEAGRLRAALARYYEREGADDPIVIVLPRGRYVPEFSWRADANRAPARAALRPAVVQEQRDISTQLDGHLVQMRMAVKDLRDAFAESRSLLARAQTLVEQSRRGTQVPVTRARTMRAKA